MTYTIEDLRSKDLIIMEARMGSHAYGTSTPESDVDIRGVFVQPLDDVLKYGFVEQISDKTNDVTFYELGRFVDLVIGNNPNIIEMLAVPDDCLIHKHPKFKILENLTDKILTKKVRWTFAGYAIDQIQKARGYNKKMNWEESQMTRKTVLDFCYVLKSAGSMPFKEWREYAIGFTTWSRRDTNQKNFGLAAIDHGHDLYAMYYSKTPIWGIVSDEEKANEVQLFSIPKGLIPVGYLYFNQDGYSSHCKKYKEYQTWLKERNENRFKMNKDHGKNYDSKNLMHCMRLLTMVEEMLDTGEIIVRRPPEHIELLMRIRRGEMEYDDLLKLAEEKISHLDEKCKNSSLPESVNKELVLNALLEIRSYFYFTLKSVQEIKLRGQDNYPNMESDGWMTDKNHLLD